MKIPYLSLLTMGMLASSCDFRNRDRSINDNDLEVITVSTPNPSLRIEDIYDSLEIVHLDDTVFLSGVADVELFDGNFYILDERRTVLALYDRNGKYISHVSKRGRGPDEYISIFSMHVDPITRKVLVTDNMQSKIFVYDLLLNHERTIVTNHHTGEVAGLRNGLFLHGQTAGIDRDDNKLLNHEIITIDSIGHVKKGFVPHRGRISTGIPLRSISDTPDGGFVVHPTLDHIIYRVAPDVDDVSPMYRVDFNVDGWRLADYNEYEAVADRNTDLNPVDIVKMLEQEHSTVAWGYIIDTDSKLLIRLGNYNPVFCIYDKNTHNTVSYFGETIKGDNGLRLLSAFPYSTSKDRLYTGINIATLKAMYRVENLSPEWAKIIEQLDIESNPVIISYRIR